MEIQKIKGRRIILKPLEESDIECLFNWRNSFDFREFFSTRKDILSLEEFKIEIENDLKHDRREQFIIQKTSTKESIGTIFLYALAIFHRNAFVTTFIREQDKTKGYGPEAFAVFVSYVMKKYNLHKIITEVYSHNTGVSRLIERAGFIKEGIFKEQRRDKDNNWIDIVRMSLFEKDADPLHRFVQTL